MDLSPSSRAYVLVKQLFDDRIAQEHLFCIQCNAYPVFTLHLGSVSI